MNFFACQEIGDLKHISFLMNAPSPPSKELPGSKTNTAEAHSVGHTAQPSSVHTKRSWSKQSPACLGSDTRVTLPVRPRRLLLPCPVELLWHLLAVARLQVQAVRACRTGEGAHRGHRQPLVVTPERSQGGNVEAALQVQAGGTAAAVAAIVSVPCHYYHGRLQTAVAEGSRLRVVPHSCRRAVTVRGHGGDLGELHGAAGGDALTGSAQRCHFLLPERKRT